MAPAATGKPKSRFFSIATRIAKRHEPRVAATFLSAVGGLQDRIDMGDLTSAVASGSAVQVSSVVEGAGGLGSAMWSAGLDKELLAVSRATGFAGAPVLTGATGVEVSFNALHPDVVLYARVQAGTLIREIGPETLEAVQSVLASGQAFGLTVDEQAAVIREAVGLTEKLASAPVTFAQELREGNFRSGRRLSAADKAAIRKRLDDGTVDEAFVRTMRARYAASLTNHRALNIARTETLRSSHHGQNEGWKQAIEQKALPPSARRNWIVTPDHRLEHEEVPGMNPGGRGMDEMFQTPEGAVLYPPSRRTRPPRAEPPARSVAPPPRALYLRDIHDWSPRLRGVRRNDRETEVKYTTDDTRITGMQEVDAPEVLLRDLPLSDAASQLVFRSRREISSVIHGQDDRVVAVVGPCSIHDPAAALEYGQRLREVVPRFSDALVIVMRVYFEKPRTTVGWKGLINDPHLDNSFGINEGLHIARNLLRDLVGIGLYTGTEYLDPISPQYVGDLVSWGAIGARTVESQVHRQLASGLSCPIGFKNSTLGSVQVAVDAVRAARGAHIFLSVTKQGRSAIFSTSGNEDCHVILRGGAAGPNYDSASVREAVGLLEKAGLPPRIMIDFSHANSRKEFRRQMEVCHDVCWQLRAGEKGIMGVMIESNLVEGAQEIGNGKLVYGQSVTDPCLGWEDTVACLEELADAARERNAK